MAHDAREQHRVGVHLGVDAGRRQRAAGETPEVLVGPRVDLPGLGGAFPTVRELPVDGRDVNPGPALQAVVDEQVLVEVAGELDRARRQPDEHAVHRGEHARVVGEVAWRVDVVTDLVREHGERVVLELPPPDRREVDHDHLVSEPDGGDLAGHPVAQGRAVVVEELGRSQLRGTRPRGERAWPLGEPASRDVDRFAGRAQSGSLLAATMRMRCESRCVAATAPGTTAYALAPASTSKRASSLPMLIVPSGRRLVPPTEIRETS